jgi:hypothetical protein
LAQKEFYSHQAHELQRKRAQLEELEQLKEEYDKLVAQRKAAIDAVEGEKSKVIDYLDEMENSFQKSKEMNNIPKSLQDLEQRALQRAREQEEKYEAKVAKLHGRGGGGKDKDKDGGIVEKKEPILPLPTNLIASLAETRSVGEVKMYFDQVLESWHKTFPKRYVPDLKIRVAPQENLPFSTMVIGNECHLTPLALGMTPRALRKLFVRSTPDYIESEQRLIDATDTMYYTPERLQFVLAKALSEASIGGPNNPLTWVKLKIFKHVSKKRYHLAREKIEMKSDTMAAHISPSVAIGGIEHVSKLNGFYEYFQHDIEREDDAILADVRLMNLINIAENIHGIKKSESLRLALNNRVTLSGNSRNLVLSVNRSLDSKTLRAHIAKHYPKTIDIVDSDVV